MAGRIRALAVGAAVLAGAAGCGSSARSGAGAPGRGPTYTIGLLTDLTGPAASSSKTSVEGVDAGRALARAAGFNLRFVTADTATSPTGALTAAQKLVQQDHVLAVVAVSALAFAAAGYLTSQGVPVVGVAEDGPEWRTSPNMFSVYGALDTTKVGTTAGQFFKSQGVTDVGTLGYGISPTSSEAAKSAAASAESAGLRIGYLNADFPFGSTNVQPVALAMKSAGVNGLEATVDPNTAFALITALRQLGDDPKVALLPTGYGGDLTQAGPGALSTAQGVYFSLQFEPVEMRTPATQRFQSALKAAGVTTEPTYGEYAGYTSVALLTAGLQKAGASPGHASLITALNGVKGFDAAGLLGSHSFDLSDRAGTALGVDGCSYMTRLNGSTFELVPGADPVCGQEIPGRSVSAAS